MDVQKNVTDEWTDRRKNKWTDNCPIYIWTNSLTTALKENVILQNNINT